MLLDQGHVSFARVLSFGEVEARWCLVHDLSRQTHASDLARAIVIPLRVLQLIVLIGAVLRGAKLVQSPQVILSVGLTRLVDTGDDLGAAVAVVGKGAQACPRVVHGRVLAFAERRMAIDAR